MPEQLDLFEPDVHAELVRLADQSHPALLPGAISRLERYHDQFSGEVPVNTQYLEAHRKRIRILLAGNTLGPVAFAAAIGEPKIAAITAVVLGAGSVFADRKIGTAGNTAQQRVDAVSELLEKARLHKAQLQVE